MTPAPDHSLAQRFLYELFGDKSGSSYVLIWTLKDRQSHWFADLGEAAKFSAQAAIYSDVYVGVSLSGKDYGAQHRCPAAETVGVIGLWADVDYLDPAHKKGNLPPQDEAAGLLADMRLFPSLTVASGHGLQPWWLFKEPWIFESDEDRQAAATLAQRWQLTMRIRARERGWDIDMTHDLARILRVPGTINWKAEPVLVTLTGR
tara:strand:+ start:1741 stop:2352 length:612 start_codon:yes stop_codon:yes gene_type:complete